MSLEDLDQNGVGNAEERIKATSSRNSLNRGPHDVSTVLTDGPNSTDLAFLDTKDHSQAGLSSRSPYNNSSHPPVLRIDGPSSTNLAVPDQRLAMAQVEDLLTGHGESPLVTDQANGTIVKEPNTRRENANTSKPSSPTARSRFRGAARTISYVKTASVPVALPCDSCRSLELDVDKFVLPTDVVATVPSNSRTSTRFHGKKQMGSYSEIKRRSESPGCQLCGLFVEALERQTSGPPDGGSICRLMWTTDGMKRVTDVEGRTAPMHCTMRLQILWRARSHEDTATETHESSYIVLVAPEEKFDPNENLFLGRLDTTLANALKDSYDLANIWYTLCTQNHGDRCGPQKSLRERANAELAGSAFFAVVDVQKMCLTDITLADNGELPAYVAMSYTWPEEVDEKARCTEKNRKKLRKPNGINDILGRLPRAVQDAIALTRKLGIQYLWVDSLCIIQDNDDNWTNNAAIMDVIYGNAAVTICAADKQADGLKALQPNTGNKHKRHAKQHTVEYRKSADDKAVTLLLSHPSESYIARSRWHRRGWTLQERLLSPRCLIFVEGRMYLQCRTTTMSEDIYSDTEIAGWSVELYGAPAQVLRKLQDNPVTVYKDLVKMYAARELSNETDILDAFKGITNLIKENVGGPCEMLHGIPNSHFDWALLWSPESALFRREGKPQQAQNFPSWSWCGWKGPKFLDDSAKRSTYRISYKASTIIGSETEFNLHNWLKKRTWITYYINDGQGRISLVWDPRRHKPNDKIEEWRGYPSPLDWQDSWTEWSYGQDAGHSSMRQPKYDLHGRPFTSSLPKKGRYPPRAGGHSDFQRILADRHMKVVVLPPGVNPKDPNKPNTTYDKMYLQFFTWSAKFQIAEQNEDAQFSKTVQPGAGLKRFAILDRNGNFAGTCVLDDSWSEAAQSQEPQEFIALSFARAFSEDECSINGFYNGPDAEAEWQLFNVMMLRYKSRHKKASAGAAPDQEPVADIACTDDISEDAVDVDGDNIEHAAEDESSDEEETDVDDMDDNAVAERAGIGKVYKNAFLNSFKNSGEWTMETHGMYWKEIILG